MRVVPIERSPQGSTLPTSEFYLKRSFSSRFFPFESALPLIREPLGSLGIVASESTGGLLCHTLECVLGCLTFVLSTALHTLS
jgi:hypothetical protein